MPFLLEDFVRLRPFAYHLTDRRNLRSLEVAGVLHPAEDLFRRGGGRTRVSRPRRDSVVIDVEDEAVVLRDQRPLILANVQLDEGWAAKDFLDYLDRHVFFWPGNERGPVKYGERLFDAYEGTSPLVLRVPTADLFASNPAVEPLFCPFNSGAPRMQQGRRVRRGPDLFCDAMSFPRRASEVVELVFAGAVELPRSTDVAELDRSWRRLSSATRDLPNE